MDTKLEFGRSVSCDQRENGRFLSGPPVGGSFESENLFSSLHHCARHSLYWFYNDCEVHFQREADCESSTMMEVMGHPWHSSRWYWYSSYSRPASIMNGSATGFGWTADESRSALAHLNQWCGVDGRHWFHAGNQSSVLILQRDRWCSAYPVGYACVNCCLCSPMFVIRPNLISWV